MTDVRRAPVALRTRDRQVIIVALIGLAALAWVYLYEAARDMDLAGMPGINGWTKLNLLLAYVMWVVMMIGMMVPTALRAVLIYAGIAQRASVNRTPVAATSWFVAGYVLSWAAFSAAATAAQWGLTRIGMLSPMAVTMSPYLGGGLLVTAGIYQLTPWKQACLSHCQSPVLYLATRFKPSTGGALGLGLRHGAYCLGCCWMLMALLFLGGVMNLLWIAVIAGFVLLEKLSSPKVPLARATGMAMIIGGICYFAVA